MSPDKTDGRSESYRERSLPGDAYWPADHAEIMARYLFAGRFAGGRQVLDAAAGTGYGTATLSALGAAFVQGIDKDANAVREAAERYASPKVTFTVDDCEHLGTVRSPMDLVCSFETIEHLESPEAFLRAVARVLAPGGIFVCSTPDRANTPPFVNGRPANPYHRFEWNREDFRALLSTHFKRVEVMVQVATFSQAARQRAADSFRNRRLMRLARRLPGWTGLPDLCASLEALAVPSIEDFPLVEERVAPLLGEALGHVAVCRVARR